MLKEQSKSWKNYINLEPIHTRRYVVNMIMKVRLKAMLKHKKTKYPNAKKVKERFRQNKYYKFLGRRTDIKDTTARKH